MPSDEIGPSLSELKDNVERIVLADLLTGFRSKSWYLVLAPSILAFATGAFLCYFFTSKYFGNISDANSALLLRIKDSSDRISALEEEKKDMKVEKNSDERKIAALKANLSHLLDYHNLPVKDKLRKDFETLNESGITIASDPVLADGKFQIRISDDCSIEVVDNTKSEQIRYHTKVTRSMRYTVRSLSIPLDFVFITKGARVGSDGNKSRYNVCYFYFSISDQNKTNTLIP